MTTEGKDETGGIDSQCDEALWSLLGRHQPPVKVSPYFARRVLREIALDEQPRGGWAGRLRGFWMLVPRHAAVWSGAFALAMLCLSAVLSVPANRSPMVPAPHVAEVAADPATPAASADPAASVEQGDARLADASAVQDEEVIADLDNLLSREESRLWIEDPDAVRF